MTLPQAGLFVLAAGAELAGCYAFWAVARLGQSPLWLLPGVLSLAVFAVVLARVDVDASGRAYAAYGGIYIALALVWLAVVDGVRPDRWDLIGGMICLAGAGVIVMGPRG